jgi:ABC-2 type transport system permease protein
VLTGSALLGGVYYPAHVIPSWLQELSRALPLTYGLRAARQASLLGESFSVIGHDVVVLALCVVVLLPIGVLSVALALHYARRTGSLGHY